MRKWERARRNSIYPKGSRLKVLVILRIIDGKVDRFVLKS